VVAAINRAGAHRKRRGLDDGGRIIIAGIERGLRIFNGALGQRGERTDDVARQPVRDRIDVGLRHHRGLVLGRVAVLAGQ
jgi:hypothetical protein